MFTTLSGVPDATPRVPPPSLILRVRDAGPIGSVSGFGRASWPGSMTIRVHGASAAPEAGGVWAAASPESGVRAGTITVSVLVVSPPHAARTRQRPLAAANVERIDQEAVVGGHQAELDRSECRLAAAVVGDLVVRARDRAPRSRLDLDVGERVGRTGELRELAAVLLERGGPAHVGPRWRAALEVGREERVEGRDVLAGVGRLVSAQHVAHRRGADRC